MNDRWKREYFINKIFKIYLVVIVVECLFWKKRNG